MRLARFLAHSGVASRRGSEELIRAGRVNVAGKVVTDPARDVDERSGVEVDGEPVRPEPREVWVLNKPKGVVSTARDPGGRPAVVDLVKSRRRLYPVGRLDADSTGVILLTNDGELANRLMHPRHQVRRVYKAKVARTVTDAQVDRLRRGVKLDDGPTGPARVRRPSPRTLEIEIREGRNRQVRRMVEAVGNEVTDLRRVRFGPLTVGGLEEGRARRLSRAELARLWEDAGE